MATTLLAPAAAYAQAWTEGDVAERAAEQAPRVIVARARAAAARARARATPRHPDPSVTFYREGTFEEGSPSDTYAALEVPIDLSGRRAVAHHLARAEAALAEADDAVAQSAAVTAAVLTFVDAVAAERAVAVRRQTVAALEEATRVLARREEAGTVAGYDRVRLELETELARSELADAEARLAVQREMLRAMIAPDLDALPALDGSLETSDPGELGRWLARAREHDGIEAARRAGEASGEAVDASATAWIPMLGLLGGVRLVDDGTETRWGYVAEVGITIPVFGGDRGLPDVAHAERAAAQARGDALARRIATGAATAHQRLVAARAELARFREATGPQIDLLLRGAESGYRAGRRTIVELLDAQRAASSVRQRALALEVEAKRAETELRGAVGDFR